MRRAAIVHWDVMAQALLPVLPVALHWSYCVRLHVSEPEHDWIIPVSMDH
jgi:hypothetical protein